MDRNDLSRLDPPTLVEMILDLYSEVGLKENQIQKMSQHLAALESEVTTLRIAFDLIGKEFRELQIRFENIKDGYNSIKNSKEYKNLQTNK